MSLKSSDQPIEKVTDKYSELFHYTGVSGLEGILKSQSLRATHALFLNDQEEITLFLDQRLPNIIWGESEKLHQNSKTYLRDISHEQKIHEDLRHSTLKFNEVYIFSMCGSKNERISRDGLLSQWRGYGKDGGYAIVFDTEPFEKLIITEANSYNYQYMQLGDLYYYDSSQENYSPEPEIRHLENDLRKCISLLLKMKYPEPKSESEIYEKLYRVITTLSCYYKHIGFHEESEVRIVAIPVHPIVQSHPKFQAEIQHGAPNQISPANKTRNEFIRNGELVPYIALFEQPEIKLPIKRVIVGPHRDKQRRKIAVELMMSNLGIDADVVVSEIPYIG